MSVHVQQCRINAASVAGRQVTGGRSVRAVLAHQHLHGHAFGGRIQYGHLVLLDLLALGLVATVLEPYFHLRLGEAQHFRQLGAFRTGQVALLCESTLQLKDLCMAEGGARALLAGECMRRRRGRRMTGGGGAVAVVGVNELLMVVMVVVVELLMVLRLMVMVVLLVGR